MYINHFGLREKPFNLTTSTKYLYLGEQHQSALTLLEYGITERAGVILLTGETGTGKTTLVRQVQDKYRHNAKIKAVFVDNPLLVGDNLAQFILDELAQEQDADDVSTLSTFKQLDILLDKIKRQGRRLLLVIDEAQGLSDQLLEQVRLFTNLQSGEESLMQVLLVGQPELKAKIQAPAMRQLAQRITVAYTIAPLSINETKAYVEHRMKIAGRAKPGLFDNSAIKGLYKASGGIPRVLNILCNMALTYGYAEDAKAITADIVSEVVQDRQDTGLPLPTSSGPAPAILSDRVVELESTVRKLERVVVRHIKQARA